MSVIVDIDGTETFGDVWDSGGAYASHTGGNIVFSGEGMIAAKDDCGSGDKWIRFNIGAVTPGERTGFFVGNSAGTGVVFILNIVSTNLRVTHESVYTTYTTYGESDTAIGLDVSVFDAANDIGVTINGTSKLIRLWHPVTNPTPDSVSSWDSGAEDASFTALAAMNVGRLGLGSWTSSPASEAYEFFVAGDFGAAAEPHPPLSHITNRSQAPFRASNY